MEQTTQNLYHLYWDADNVSLINIPKVRDFFAARDLTPKVCRAFGCCLSKKQVALLSESGFEPICIKPGANATDFRLTISAVADRHPERRDVIGVVSNDNDFIPLISHLKEQGHQTILFAEKSASQSLRKAANEFALLERSNAAMATTPHQPSVSIKDAITDILAMHQRPTPPTVADVGNQLALRYPKLQRDCGGGRLSRRLREIGFVLTKFCRRGGVAEYFVSLPPQKNA
jgi:uncharacterized protein (TIGR00288 family)